MFVRLSLFLCLVSVIHGQQQQQQVQQVLQNQITSLQAIVVQLRNQQYQTLNENAVSNTNFLLRWFQESVVGALYQKMKWEWKLSGEVGGIL